MQVYHSFANGLGHGDPEYERGHKIEKSGPNNSQSRRKHSSRNDSGNTVGCVMETVDEIKGQCHQDGDGCKNQCTVQMQKLTSVTSGIRRFLEPRFRAHWLHLPPCRSRSPVPRTVLSS